MKLEYGFIEDNNDPLKMGRCRVRIVGLHTSNREILPTNKLPWAIPITDFSSDINSSNYTPPVNGTPIVGYFQDDTLQTFFMLGTLPINYDEIPDNTKGFSDPEGKYPKKTGTNINDLAKNENIENTIVTKKKNELIQGSLFSEPETTYNAQYPYNKVYEDTAGNIIEVDATPGAERIHVYHKSGSFVEFTNDGVVIKIQGDYYQFSKTANFYVDGDCNIESTGNANIKCKKLNIT